MPDNGRWADAMMGGNVLLSNSYARGCIRCGGPLRVTGYREHMESIDTTYLKCQRCGAGYRTPGYVEKEFHDASIGSRDEQGNPLPWTEAELLVRLAHIRRWIKPELLFLSYFEPVSVEPIITKELDEAAASPGLRDTRYKDIEQKHAALREHGLPRIAWMRFSSGWQFTELDGYFQWARTWNRVLEDFGFIWVLPRASSEGPEGYEPTDAGQLAYALYQRQKEAAATATDTPGEDEV